MAEEQKGDAAAAEGEDPDAGKDNHLLLLRGHTHNLLDCVLELIV